MGVLKWFGGVFLILMLGAFGAAAVLAAVTGDIGVAIVAGGIAWLAWRAMTGLRA